MRLGGWLFLFFCQPIFIFAQIFLAEKLESLAKEESGIAKLMKEAQKKAFEEKSISHSDYYREMLHYEGRLRKMRIIPAIIIFSCIMAAFVSAETNITRQDAAAAINNALQSMQEMKESGFSIIYINDTIIAAKEALQKTDSALKMKYKGFSYEDVMAYTNAVQSTREKAYLLANSIRALEIKADEYRAEGIEISEAKALIQDAKAAFENERYGEAEIIAENANMSLEQAKSQMTIGKAIARSARGFFEQYWKHIIAILSITFVSGTAARLIIRKRLRKRKLRILNIEKQTLVDMIKEAQMERFESGRISDFTYRIRMEVYKKKLAEIKRKIPVLEAQAEKKKK